MIEEIVDIVDGHGRVLRKAPKHEAHERGWLHKTVIGYVRKDDHWALVRQAADRQDAGQLVAPVGGHVQAGETDIEALLREAEEEIGTRNIEYSHVGVERFHRQVIGRDENHLFVIYEIWTEDDINLGEEAIAIEWFTSERLKRALHETPEHFGDAYFFVLEHFYPEFLPQTHAFRWKTS